MDKKLYLSFLAAIGTATAIGLFAFLAAPIAKPLAWAVIIGIATMPHYNHILHKFPAHPGRSAGIMVLIVTICFIAPIASLVVAIATNAVAWYAQAEQIISSISKSGGYSLNNVPLVPKILTLAHKLGIDLAGIGGRLGESGSKIILNTAGNTAKNLFDLFFTMAVALFILFFIYRDGERIVAKAVERFAPDCQRTKRKIREIRSITTAVTVGNVFTCFVQGLTAGVGYYFADVPAPILCAALTAITALVPVVGTGLVWVPLVIWLAINSTYYAAGLLALWCIIFVSLADNAIRPLAIGAAKDISVLAVVLGAICGVITMGLLGLILGPVLFAILMSAWREANTDDEQIDYAGNLTKPPE